MNDAAWLMSAAEVAARMQRSVDWFYHHRKALEAKGLPKPHDAFLPVLMYSRMAVRAWIEGEPKDVAAAGDEDLTGWAERLDANAAELAERYARRDRPVAD